VKKSYDWLAHYIAHVREKVATMTASVVLTDLCVPTVFSPKELMAAALCCRMLATKWDYLIRGNKRKEEPPTHI